MPPSTGFTGEVEVSFRCPRLRLYLGRNRTIFQYLAARFSPRDTLAGLLAQLKLDPSFVANIPPPPVIFPINSPLAGGRRKVLSRGMLERDKASEGPQVPAVLAELIGEK